MIWKSSKKIINTPGQGKEDPPGGKKYIKPQVLYAPKRTEKLHIKQRECPAEWSDLKQSKQIRMCEDRPGLKLKTSREREKKENRYERKNQNRMKIYKFEISLCQNVLLDLLNNFKPFFQFLFFIQIIIFD